VTLRVTTNAALKQRVRVLVAGNWKVFQGTGENSEIGRETFTLQDDQKTVSVTIEHSCDNGSTWKPSQYKLTDHYSSGAFNKVSVISEDAGGDNDWNDAIAEFSWNIRPPICPPPVDSNEVTVTFDVVSPTQVNLKATVNASYVQKVVIVHGKELTYVGSGLNKDIARETITVNKDSSVKVIISHSTDGGRTFKPSLVRLGPLAVAGNNREIVVSSDDSAGDRDFNDAVVQFSWTVPAKPTAPLPVASGEYYIQSVSSGLYLDGETTSIHQFDNTHGRAFLSELHPGDTSQIWRIQHVANGEYLLINLFNEKSYDGDTTVDQLEANYPQPFLRGFGDKAGVETRTRLWKVEPVANNFGLLNVAANKALDANVGAAKQADPRNPSPFLWQWAAPHGNNHLWRLIPKADVPYTPPPPPPQEPANCRRFYHREDIKPSTVVVTGLKWTEVTQYTRTVKIPADLENVVVRFNFPFSGNETANVRSRIRLQFDGLDVAEEAVFDSAVWALRTIDLEGVVETVTAGDHTVKVFAVSEGRLHLPHHNNALIEETLAPPVLVRFYVYN